MPSCKKAEGSCLIGMSIPKLTKIYKLLDPEIRSKNRQALQYWLRERYYQVVWPTMPDPIFVTGCCRSRAAGVRDGP